MPPLWGCGQRADCYGQGAAVTAPRPNLRRAMLDILTPVLAIVALDKLYHAAELIEPVAPVSAWLLRFWLVLVVVLGLWAAYRIGESYE